MYAWPKESKRMKRGCLLVLLSLVCLPLAAQQMSVAEFARLKRPLWKRSSVTVDKTRAILDFVTDEKGFTFLSNGTLPADAEEGEGVVTVLLPHKTAYVTIIHPEYGQLMWRVPEGKRLRKRNHYQAFLFAGDPTKEYRASSQWVVFHLNPRDAIVQIDSLSRPVRKEVVEYYLPVGEPRYRVEAPFHEPQEAVFTLTDSLRKDITVNLQPFYSYLTVKTAWQGGDLYIDNARIRKEDATSYRLGEGHHLVAFFWADECFYDSLVYVGRAEKKILELQVKDLYPRSLRRTSPVPVNPPRPLPAGEDGAARTPIGAPVKLTAADSLAWIWVDREPVGLGHWEGILSPGYHLAQTVKDGEEGIPTGLWIKDEFPQEVALQASGVGSGLLNIHCNVAGARILINGTDFGETPQIVRLDASRSYKLALSKSGYKDRMETVRPRGNHMVDVYIELKKKK